MSKTGRRENQRSAFTMAEILLSLTIIGVVAAITLPSLTGNINERTWNTQRKALYARMSQAIALMPALNGYGTLTAGDSSNSAVDTAAETFVTAGLSKVLKINNICDSEHLADCGIPEKMNPLAGSVFTTPKKLSELNVRMLDNTGTFDATRSDRSAVGYSALDTKTAAFETANGESVVVFYNPNCQAAMAENYAYAVQPKICANFIFDLNGSKGPNTVGKDIGFMTVLYSSDSSVVLPNIPPQKAATDVEFKDALSVCKKQDSEYRIPTLDELASIFMNNLLIDGQQQSSADVHWSATSESSSYAWAQGFHSGGRYPYYKGAKYSVRCVKR